MLASSPSPSAVLRPSPSSPSTTRSHPHPLPPSSSSPSVPRRHSSTTASSAAPALAAYPSHQQQYDPAPHDQPTSSNYVSSNSPRVAIEELRSALTRHTVATSPSGPSGDHPRGRTSAGLTTLGAENPGASNPSVSSDLAVQGPDLPANNVPAVAPPPPAPAPASASAPQSSLAPPMPASHNSTGSGSNKRNSPNDAYSSAAPTGHLDGEASQSKRLRSSRPDIKVLPAQYELADTKDLVVLVSSMIMELIRYNDKIPLNQGRLTRFHSRSPPRISVQDYLQRLTTHATLSPPILLSMVYYIDRLCALYPAFTVSSLTIHRFLIASATVASKGLSDSFWTNKTYARVGGVSMTELALLELEFLFRVEWRIVPQPEVLVDYYQSLVERCEGYEIQRNN